MTRMLFVLLSSVLLAAATAAAQDPDTANPTITIGPLSIRPSFVIKNIGRDDNVFNEDTAPRHDFTMTFSPGAQMAFKARRLKVSFTEGVDYLYFKKYTTERGTNLTSSVRVDVDLGVLQPFASTSGLDSKDRFNNEIDARARHHDRSYAAGLGLKLFTRTKASLGVRQTTYRFDEGTTFRGQRLADTLNSQVDAVDGSVGFDLTPLTSFSLNVAKERQRFDSAPDRDSDTIRIMPTFLFSPLGLINGSASVGYRKFSPRSSRTAAFTGLVAQVGAGFTLYDRHRIDLAVNRDLTYSYDTQTPYYIATSESATWTYAFAGPFDLKLNAAHNNMHYRAPDGAAVGDDTYASYGAGLGYRLRRRIRFGVQGDWSKRDSARAPDRGYTNQRIYGTLTWGI